MEGRAHALIDMNTFPFLNGVAHFLPNGRLQEVTERLKALEADFWKTKAAFIEKYGELRQEASKEWSLLAEKLSDDPRDLLRAIEDSFPTVQKVGRMFDFDVQLFQISLPERLSVNLVSTGHQQELVTARQNAVQQASMKINQGVEAFVADCVASLRQETANLCEEMLKSINSSETGVHQKTLNRLIRFIDQFKQMNFVSDVEMEKQLETVRNELLSKTAEEYRDSKSAQLRLKQGLAQLGETARQLVSKDASELVQRFGELGKRKFNLAA